VDYICSDGDIDAGEERRYERGEVLDMPFGLKTAKWARGYGISAAGHAGGVGLQSPSQVGCVMYFDLDGSGEGTSLVRCAYLLL
jgi:hypothetical protein